MLANTGSTQNAISPEQIPHPVKKTVGLLIKDGMCRRLIEGVVVNLDLAPFTLQLSEVDPLRTTDFELLIAYEKVARELRPMIQEAQRVAGADIEPALIAVVPAPYTPSAKKEKSSDFGAVLAMPEKPATVTTKLSVALYADRALATHHSAM